MSETDSARRVVLLARPGPARDRMREALAQVAADVVLEADPTVTDPADVRAARPDVALIVLDAATDEALDRFDALLADPSVEVLFEEAELAVGRVGWDAARWVRHLSAKLHRTSDVLPPGHSQADEPAQSAAPAAAAIPASPPSVTPVVPSPAATAAPAVPAAPAAAPAQPDGARSEPAPTATAAPSQADWSLSDLQVPELPELQVPELPADATEKAEAPSSGLLMPELESSAFDMPSSTTPMELPPLELPDEPAPASRPGFQSTFDVHGDLDALEAEPISLAPLQLDEEFLTTSADAVVPLDLNTNIDLVDSELGDQAARYTTEHHAEPAPPMAAKLELELLDDTAPGIQIEGADQGSDNESDTHRFQNDLADLHSRIASMELVVDRPPTQVRGAVLVLAGIGGPDAVRQLLGALPDTFPRAVLVQQRLDGGHYDKLVAQMQRATSLLVELAVPGRPLQPSSVYIMPPTVGVEEGRDGGLAFSDTPGDLLASLPAGDSAVLMLSGSDPANVDAVMKLSAGGALVAAQALDGCYDVAAPAALASRGGVAGKPQELAKRLADRWAA